VKHLIGTSISGIGLNASTSGTLARSLGLRPRVSCSVLNLVYAANGTISFLIRNSNMTIVVKVRLREPKDRRATENKSGQTVVQGAW
jgi:hypothetical protein